MAVRRRDGGLQAGISKSEVSRICAELDESLETFRARPLGHVAFPYRDYASHQQRTGERSVFLLALR